MENKPSISVLMPAYNAEKYISLAIESILNQTLRNFELIIIDDCSTDDTWNIIQQYANKDSRIKGYRNAVNSKICKTLNRGISLVKGDLIARMDADDWSYPERLEKQFQLMKENEDIVISGGTIEICDSEMIVLNKRKYNLSDKKIREKIFKYSPFCHPAVIMRTGAILKAGKYDENLFDAEDYDMYFRIGKFGEFKNLPDTILKLRTSPSSVSQKNARRQEKLTLKIREKATKEYGYKMNYSDKLYFYAQLMSMYIIPQKFKFRLFNFFRKYLL